MLYRIGSIRKSQMKFYTKKPVNWSNDSINVLGVEIAQDETELCKLNYAPLMGKLKIFFSHGVRDRSVYLERYLSLMY